MKGEFEMVFLRKNENKIKMGKNKIDANRSRTPLKQTSKMEFQPDQLLVKIH